MGTREILLATGNPNKAREMREILGLGQEAGSLLVSWRSLEEFAERGWPEPVEDGPTFAANAQIKARHYALLSGLWTLADDSGLEVDALGGEPGIRSARYAGWPRDDRANNALLIRRVSGVPAEERSARFRCAAVVSDGRRILASAEGIVEGRIIDQPRGYQGFGYDPHFWIDALGMTAAEMLPEQKHAVSHRGRALRQLKKQLEALVAS